jgi:hypothetical protein
MKAASIKENMLTKIFWWPFAVAHTCNPHYSGGRIQEDHGSRPVQAKSSQDPFSTNSWVGMVVHVCHLSYMGKHK